MERVSIDGVIVITEIEEILIDLLYFIFQEITNGP